MFGVRQSEGCIIGRALREKELKEKMRALAPVSTTCNAINNENEDVSKNVAPPSFSASSALRALDGHYYIRSLHLAFSLEYTPQES